MGAIVFMVGMVILFFILSVTFLRGKGSFLIAGYNTAPEEERKKYDEKKLCRSMGVCMLFITCLLGIMTYVCCLAENGNLDESVLETAAGGFIAAAMGAVVIEMIYAAKKCRHQERQYDKKTKEQARTDTDKKV